MARPATSAAAVRSVAEQCMLTAVCCVTPDSNFESLSCKLHQGTLHLTQPHTPKPAGGAAAAMKTRRRSYSASGGGALAQLPPDLLRRLVLLMTAEDVARASSTCRAWAKLLRAGISRALVVCTEPGDDAHDQASPHPCVASLARHSPDLEHLELLVCNQSCHMGMMRIVHNLDRLRRLRRITISTLAQQSALGGLLGMLARWLCRGAAQHLTLECQQMTGPSITLLLQSLASRRACATSLQTLHLLHWRPADADSQLAAYVVPAHQPVHLVLPPAVLDAEQLQLLAKLCGLTELTACADASSPLRQLLRLSALESLHLAGCISARALHMLATQGQLQRLRANVAAPLVEPAVSSSSSGSGSDSDGSDSDGSGGSSGSACTSALLAGALSKVPDLDLGLVHRGRRLPEPVRLVVQRLEPVRLRGLRLHGLGIDSADVTAIGRHLTALTCLELHVAPVAAAGVEELPCLLDLSPLHSLAQLAVFALDLRRLGDKAAQALQLKCATPQMEAEADAAAVRIAAASAKLEMLYRRLEREERQQAERQQQQQEQEPTAADEEEQLQELQREFQRMRSCRPNLTTCIGGLTHMWPALRSLQLAGATPSNVLATSWDCRQLSSLTRLVLQFTRDPGSLLPVRERFPYVGLPYLRWDELPPSLVVLAVTHAQLIVPAEAHTKPQLTHLSLAGSYVRPGAPKQSSGRAMWRVEPPNRWKPCAAPLAAVAAQLPALQSLELINVPGLNDRTLDATAAALGVFGTLTSLGVLAAGNPAVTHGALVAVAAHLATLRVLRWHVGGPCDQMLHVGSLARLSRLVCLHIPPCVDAQLRRWNGRVVPEKLPLCDILVEKVL